jgi:hypothetical protein
MEVKVRNDSKGIRDGEQAGINRDKAKLAPSKLR